MGEPEEYEDNSYEIRRSRSSVVTEPTGRQRSTVVTEAGPEEEGKMRNWRKKQGTLRNRGTLKSYQTMDKEAIKKGLEEMKKEIAVQKEAEEKLSALNLPVGFSKYAEANGIDISGLTKDQMGRQQIIYEMIQTEWAYVNDLTTIIRHMLEPLRDRYQDVCTPEDISTLFQNVEALRPIHEPSLANMLARLEEEKMPQYIGDLIIPMLQATMPYSEYLCHFGKAQKAFTRISTDKKSSAAIAYIMAQPDLKGIDFSSWLIKPVQRIMKYPLLLRDLIKKTEEGWPEGHPDMPNMQAAFDIVNKNLEDMNEEKRVYEAQIRCETLMGLIEDLNGWDLTKRPLIKEGFLYEFTDVKMKERYGLLFPDVLLLVKPLNSKKGTYGLRDAIPLSEAILEDVFSTKEIPDAIKIIHIGKQFILCCENGAEKDTWFRILSEKVDAAVLAAAEKHTKDRKAFSMLESLMSVNPAIFAMMGGKGSADDADNQTADLSAAPGKNKGARNRARTSLVLGPNQNFDQPPPLPAKGPMANVSAQEGQPRRRRSSLTDLDKFQEQNNTPPPPTKPRPVAPPPDERLKQRATTIAVPEKQPIRRALPNLPPPPPPRTAANGVPPAKPTTPAAEEEAPAPMLRSRLDATTARPKNPPPPPPSSRPPPKPSSVDNSQPAPVQPEAQPEPEPEAAPAPAPRPNRPAAPGVTYNRTRTATAPSSTTQEEDNNNKPAPTPSPTPAVKAPPLAPKPVTPTATPPPPAARTPPTSSNSTPPTPAPTPVATPVATPTTPAAAESAPPKPAKGPPPVAARPSVIGPPTAPKPGASALDDESGGLQLPQRAQTQVSRPKSWQRPQLLAHPVMDNNGSGAAGPNRKSVAPPPLAPKPAVAAESPANGSPNGASYQATYEPIDQKAARARFASESAGNGTGAPAPAPGGPTRGSRWGTPPAAASGSPASTTGSPAASDATASPGAASPGTPATTGRVSRWNPGGAGPAGSTSTSTPPPTAPRSAAVNDAARSSVAARPGGPALPAALVQASNAQWKAKAGPAAKKPAAVMSVADRMKTFGIESEAASSSSTGAAPAQPAGTYTLAQLREEVGKPGSTLDQAHLETYLSDADFQATFDMDREMFNSLLKWKQEMLRKKHGLF